MATPAKKTKKKKSAEPKITPDMLMGQIVQSYPQATDVLVRYGFHCIGCVISPYESLESGAAVHGIPLDPLLKELNELVA